MKAVSREQAVAVMATLMANVDWNELDGKLLQDEVFADPKDAGKRFTQFLKNGAKAVVTVVASFVLKLASSFDSTEFIGKGWSVWKGPADGNGLEGDEDRDVREDDLAEIDWSHVEFETCLKEGESCITGEEKFCRLKKSGKICYGGRAFLSLWKDYQEKGESSVLENLYRTKGITYVDFFGLILRTSDGYRRVLYLFRRDGGRWGWGYYWLDRGWSCRNFSAVSAQVSSN